MAPTNAEIMRRLDEMQKIWDERRRVDDEREKAAQKREAVLIERIDGHGKRTSAMETNWANFFDPDKGAFRHFVKTLERHDMKLNWLLGVAFMGVGGVAVLKFIFGK